MSGWGVGHTHRTKLQERLAERDAAQQKLPVAHVTGAILVGGASGATTNAVDVLIAFGRIFRKVDACTEHPADIGVPLVESLLHDGVNER